MFNRPTRAGLAALVLSTALAAPAFAQGVPVTVDDEPVTVGGVPLIAGERTGNGNKSEVELYGRVMVDHTFASADEADVNFSSTQARRLRLGVKGKFGDRVKYNVELNTDSSGDINAEDAWVQYYPTGGSWSVIVGQDNTHNSFDELSSSRFISFSERAAFTDAFQLDRRLGISVLDKGSNWTAAAGVHTVNLENSGTQNGWAASARVTGTPVNTDDFLLHLGAHWRYRDQGESDGLLRYRQRPQSAGLDRIISTGRIAEEDNLYGVELYTLGNEGRYWAGGEYVLTEAEGTPDGISEDSSFSGSTLTGGLAFGGGRTYKDGVWKRPRVDNPVGDGGYGALLVEARWDTLDLEDDAIDGGKLDTYALAADWYLTKYVHFGVTGFIADADLGTSTSGLGSEFADLVTAGVEEEEVSGVVFRAQFDFGSVISKF